MNKKKVLNSFSGLVYSTNPDAIPEQTEDKTITLAPKDQKLRIIIDRKQRKGKTVTIVTNFIGDDEDLKQLGKELKTMCGTGGNVKDGEILIQGDFKDKIVEWLKKNEYTQTK